MILCNACDQEVEERLDLGLHPIVNQLIGDPATAVNRYPMRVGGCTNCGLVQITSPIEASLFYTNYSTPTSWKFEPHLHRLLSRLEDLVDSQASILDVGCNDGRFLSLMSERGWRRLSGLEPTYNTFLEVSRRGLAVRHGFLDERAAVELVAESGQRDCVTLRQVLEHVVDLPAFVRSLNRLLRVGGLLVVEVPDSRNNFMNMDYAFWEEHVNYFTPETLDALLVAHGFEIVESYESVFSGICLTTIARKSTDVAESHPIRLAPEILRDQVETFRNWAAEFPHFRAAVTAEIEARRNDGPVALYGVGSRSSNFVNIMGISALIDYAIDDQPEKQFKFMPGSGIPILSSSEIGRNGRQRPGLTLLGVNAESEDAVIAKSELLRDGNFASVLPPSRYLLDAWGRSPERGVFGIQPIA